jgi:predicted transcriptional regulator
MRLLCETATFEFLPAIRALITKELIQAYNYNQSEVAKALCITQPAVSQYKKELRGQGVKVLEKDADVANFVKMLCAEINSGRVKPEELHARFCEVCKILRKKKLVCVDIPGIC